MSDIQDWRGFHLHYHGETERMLLRLVRPLVSALAAERLAGGFFFIRYRLGGPHVRLRLRVSDAALDVVQARVEASAAAFFAENPSTTTLSDDEIRREDEMILAGDPNETATGVVPAPSVHLRSFKPETWRYGGADLVPCSIDYFCVSSTRALRFLERHAGFPQSSRLPAILGQLVAEASEFAMSADEVLEYLGPRLENFPDALQRIITRADRAFEDQRAGLCRIARAELEAGCAGARLDPLAPGKALRAAIRPEPIETRLRIIKSQLHISANRLGLSTAEEEYLRRIAWAATSAVLTEDAVLRARLDAGPTYGGSGAAMALRDAASRALDALAHSSAASCGILPPVA